MRPNFRRKFDIEAALNNPTNGRIVAAEIPKKILQSLLFVAASGSNLLSQIWCGEGELNPHALRHMPLKHACLPVPPSPRKSHVNKAVILYNYLLFLSRRIIQASLEFGINCACLLYALKISFFITFFV